jgi:predicted nucleic acid-binding Zn ribbon protein
MKRCPECSSTYPDSERFCSSDGAQLVPVEAGAHPTVQTPPPAATEPRVECPVCGGKALPGEELCSFCGARLNPPEAPPQPSFTIPRQTVYTPRPTASQSFPDEPVPIPDQNRRGFPGFVVYVAAALIALAAGAWFALHLSRTGPASRTAQAPSAAPAASPAVSGPIAALAVHQPVQVTGESAGDPARNPDVAKKLFSSNSSNVLDIYKKALASDGSLSDGVLATLTVNPAGNVVAGSVKVSTTPNPALDAELIKTMMGWHFAPFSGGSVEVSYPVVMARNAGESASVESALADKMARMAPGESPEFASAPPSPEAASPIAASSPAPAAGSSPAPEVAAREPITAPAAAPEAVAPPVPESAPAAPERPRRPHRGYAPPPPKVSLLTKVQERLRTDRRLGRVKVYTNGGGVVTLYGTVFDDKARRLAISTARSVDGVTDVIDSLQTDTARWARQEAAIAAQLQSAGLSQVSVKVIGHDAYLSGQVGTEAQKEHAVTVAEGAAPVHVRTNLIRVVPAGVFGF